MALKLPVAWVVIVILFACDTERYSATSVELGKVESRLREASGLAASIRNPGYLWVVNDGGNAAEVFLLNLEGHIVLTYNLPEVCNRDWEDIAVGTDTLGRNFIYVADIGDNHLRYPYKMLYRFEEPCLTDAGKTKVLEIDAMVLRSPDMPFDAEAILVDAPDNFIYLLSKDRHVTTIYRGRMEQDTVDLNQVLILPFSRIVAGSITIDQQHVLLKNYSRIYYWARSDGETMLQMLNRPPLEIPYYLEWQGEAIAWSVDTTEFYTLGESTRLGLASLNLHKHPRTNHFDTESNCERGVQVE